jgi:hypothetical protein
MKQTLRWIAVIPSAFAGYAMSNMIQNLFATEWMPVDALYYLQSHPDLGQYEIGGGLYSFILGLESTIVAMYAA